MYFIIFCKIQISLSVAAAAMDVNAANRYSRCSVAAAIFIHALHGTHAALHGVWDH